MNCCKDFELAQEVETDNAGFGTLLHGDPMDKTNAWFIGYELKPIKFCPWCGKTTSGDLTHERDNHPRLDPRN